MSATRRTSLCLVPLLAAASADALNPPADVAHDWIADTTLSIARLPEGIEDESAYERWLDRQADEAIAAAERADDPARRIEHQLAAVNAILASQCEPPLSRWLLGLDDENDRARVRERTAAAAAMLKLAREQLRMYEESPDPVEAAADYFSESIQLFQAFAEALDACVTEDAGDDARKRFRAAARDLSEYLEDDRPEVAAAAMLWQGALFARADRIDRALRALPLPGEPPRRGALRYDFFARLMRCRYLARREAYAAAWTLLLGLEERARDWFPTERQRSEAARATLLVKSEICHAWSTHGDDAADTRAWCAETLDRIHDERFPSDTNHAVMRLHTAVPLLIAADFDQDVETKAGDDPTDAEDDQQPETDPSKDDDDPGRSSEPQDPPR